MKNEGITELHFHVIDNKSVHPATKGAARVIVAPGEEIPVDLTEDEHIFLTKTGHIGGIR